MAFYSGMAFDIGEAHGDQTFTDNAGTGDHIDPTIVAEDLAKLVAASEAIGRLATRKIAHGTNRLVPSTTFNDVDDSIEVIKAIAQKYILLLTSGYNELEPIMSDWQEIFTTPWLSGYQ